MKLGPIQRKWLTALRSGKYKQSRGQLRNAKGFCCLGVACDILGVRWKELEGGDFAVGKYNEIGQLTYTIRKQLGMKTLDGTIATYSCGDTRSSLATLNDNGKNFDEIADAIEKNADKLFYLSV